jgi:hypothetical protein
VRARKSWRVLTAGGVRWRDWGQRGGDGIWTIQVGGNDIYGTSDQSHYVSQSQASMTTRMRPKLGCWFALLS